MSKVKTFFKVDWKTKYLAVKIFLLCGIARVLILIVPFRKLQPYLGRHNEETSYKIEKETYKVAHQISWMTQSIATHTPWQSKCLVQAIVAQYLLKKKSIPTTLYLGVTKSERKGLLAHAWLRCGKMYITGGRSKDAFKIISKFSNEQLIKK